MTHTEFGDEHEVANGTGDVRESLAFLRPDVPRFRAHALSADAGTAALGAGGARRRSRPAAESPLACVRANIGKGTAEERKSARVRT